MIIVTGTKRSGTSMWMQILQAAGFGVLGEAFPRDWAETIRAANPEGFYESPLRGGIYYATNPNPRTGEYLHPEPTRNVAVKVFVPGLIKSDMAFIHKVVATMRNYREYAPSLERLYKIEREAKVAADLAKGLEPLPPVEFVPPWLEWWADNYRLLCDALTRRYPLHMVSYDSVLEQPERIVRQTLQWLGGGNVEEAIARVREALRTQKASPQDLPPVQLAPEFADVFDELYRRVHEQEPLDAAFIERLNLTHEKLEPELRAAEARHRESRRRVRALREERKRKGL